jgi:hypothetical protein
MKTVIPASRPTATFTPTSIDESDANADIAFERPDGELTVDAKVDPRTPAFFKHLKREIPPWRFRCVDYFLGGVDLFTTALTKDYRDQKTAADARKATLARFTWKNGGGLAENFATALDQTKSLHDALSLIPAMRARLPAFPVFAEAAMSFMRMESPVPEAILGDKTYRVKFKDWAAGGTRYNNDRTESKANVKFADESARRVKVRNFLARRIDPAATGKSAFDLALESSSTRVAIFDGRELTGRPEYTPTVRVRGASPATAGAGGAQPQRAAPLGPAAMKSPHGTSDSTRQPTSLRMLSSDERVDQGVRVALQRLLGGNAAFPDAMRASMGDFVQLCETARSYGIRKVLLELIQRSSAAMQACWVRTGGLKALLRYIVDAMRAQNQHGFMRYLEHAVELRCAISEETRRIWTRNPFDASDNTEPKITARLAPGAGGACPAVLKWMREYVWKMPDGREAVLDARYTTNLIDRFERTLAGRVRHEGTTAVAHGSILSKSERRQASQKDGTALAASLARERALAQAAREEQMHAMTKIVQERIRARQGSGQYSHAGAGGPASVIRPLGPNGPIAGTSPGDLVAPPLPTGTVECLCVKCMGPEHTGREVAQQAPIDPYALLGIDRP